MYASSFMNLCFSGKKFSGRILCADMQCLLLGTDFLCDHQLLVDLANICLVDATFCSVLPCAPDVSGAHPLCFQPIIEQVNEFSLLLAEYSELMSYLFSFFPRPQRLSPYFDIWLSCQLNPEKLCCPVLTLTLLYWPSYASAPMLPIPGLVL